MDTDLTQSVHDIASVPVPQKKNRLFQSIDQTSGDPRFDFNNLHRAMCPILTYLEETNRDPKM